WMDRMLSDPRRSRRYLRAGVTPGTNDEGVHRALIMLASINPEAARAEAIEEFADKYLTPEAWRALRNALRQGSHYRRSSKKMVRIEARLHHALARVAEADGVSLEGALARIVEREV